MTNSTAVTAARNGAKAPAAPKPPISKGGALAALVPADLDQAFRLAQALAGSGDMVPKHFQGKAQACMAAIVQGMEVGLNPMQSLRSIAVINGRATIWGDALPALVMRAGHHVDVEIQGEGEKAVAVATLTRGDTGKEIVRRFSMADAKRAGLTGKQGPWTQYPTRMLSHRARSWAIRDGAADALMGLGVAEEVQDHGPDAARDVTPAAPRRGGVVYDAPPAEPERDEIVDAEAAYDPGEVMDDDADHAELADRILTALEHASADSVRTHFAEALAAMEREAPDDHARVMAELEAAS